MKTFARNLVVASAVALLALPALAGAYVLDEDGRGHPLHWSDADLSVPYLLVRDNAPSGADGEQAVHRAFETWSEASDNVDYHFAGYANSGVQGYDLKNMVYWVHSGWRYDPSAAALTFRFFDTGDGRLVDADIVFNGERFSWTVGGPGYDIENSAAHEVGHMSGLGHSSDDDSTMFARTLAGETSKRSLELDDLNGLDAIYGGAATAISQLNNGGVDSGGSSGVTGDGGGGGGCAIGGSQSRAGAAELPLLAIVFALIIARRFPVRRRGAAA